MARCPRSPTSPTRGGALVPLLRMWPLSYPIFREEQNRFLPSLSGRSPVNCSTECGPGLLLFEHTNPPLPSPSSLLRETWNRVAEVNSLATFLAVLRSPVWQFCRMSPAELSSSGPGLFLLYTDDRQ